MDEIHAHLSIFISSRIYHDLVFSITFLIEVWLEVYLATRRWKERDSGNEQVAKKRAHLRKEGVLRDPVKGFAGWWYIFIEHCAWKTLPTRLVHNFLIIDPFLTIFMPLESWEWELSNGIKITKNGHVLRKLWADQWNHPGSPRGIAVKRGEGVDIERKNPILHHTSYPPPRGFSGVF